MFSWVVSGIVVVVFASMSNKKRFFVDPFSWLFYGYFMFSFFIPLNMALTSDRIIPFLNGQAYLIVSDETIDAMVLLGLFGFFGVSLGYSLVSKNFLWNVVELDSAGYSEIEIEKIWRNQIILSMGVTIFFVATQAGSIALSLQGYAENVSESAENSLYGFLKYFTFFCISCAISFNILYRARPIRAVLTAMIIFCSASIFLFSKTYFMLAIFSVFCYLHRIKFQRIGLAGVGSVLIGLVVMYVLMPAYSIYRGTGTFELQRALESKSEMIYSDPIGPFGIFTYLYKFEAGVTIPDFLYSFILWIPRFIWPNRPLDAAEATAQSLLPNWTPGAGMAFSPLVEGYLRGGYLGCFVLLLCLGATLAGLAGAILRLYPSIMRVPILTSIVAYIFFMCNRGAYSGVFTQILQFFMPYTFLFYLISNLNVSGSSSEPLERARGMFKIRRRDRRDRNFPQH